LKDSHDVELPYLFRQDVNPYTKLKIIRCENLRFGLFPPLWVEHDGVVKQLVRLGFTGFYTIMDQLDGDDLVGRFLIRTKFGWAVVEG